MGLNSHLTPDGWEVDPLVSPYAKTYTDPTTGQTVIVGPDGVPLNAFNTESSIYLDALKATYFTNSITGNGAVTNEVDDQYGQVLVLTPGDAAPYGVARDLPQSTNGYHAISFLIKKDALLTNFQVQLFFKNFTYQTYITLDKNPSSLDVDTWQRLVIPVGGADGSFGTIDAATVKTLRAIKFRATGAGTKLRIADFKVHAVFSKSVTFFFDDARKDTFTTAYPVLKANGYTGAIAVEHLNVGDANRCTQTELNQLYAEGWTMVGHDTLPFNVTEAEQIAKHRAIKNYLATSGFVRGQHIFAWPGGIRTLAIEAVGRKYWQVMRPVSRVHDIGIPGVYDSVRPQHFYIGSAVTLNAAKAALDKISIGGGNVVFTFHTIVDSESAPEDWSIAKFTALVEHARSLGLLDGKIEKIWPEVRG